jgi:multicomponent Na+:H+ antiporter subunit B
MTAITAELTVVLTFALLTAVAATFLRDVLNAIIAFAAFSFGIAVAWLLLAAPDVALTEAAVGAGITTVFFLVTIAKTVRPGGERLFEPIAWRSVAVVAVLVGALLTTVRSLPAVGAVNSPVATSRITEYYLGNAYDQTGVENAVTAVLAAYRGFDTLGEATVVIAAGLAVLLVLRQEAYV